MLEKLHDWYFEEMRGLVPLHRMLGILLGFLLIGSSHFNCYKSNVENFLNLRISQFSFGNDGIFEHAIILDILLSISAAAMAWIASYLAARTLLYFIHKRLDLKRLANTTKNSLDEILSKKDFDIKSTIEKIDEKLEARQIVINRLRNASEFCLTLALCSVMPISKGGILDALLVAALICLFVALTMLSMYAFFKHNFRYELLKASLLSREVNTDPTLK